MKKYLISLFVCLNSICFGQSLSNYKYVVIPATFSFQKTPHQYNLNRLTQFLLNKYDFESFIEEETNEDFKNIDVSKLLRLRVEEKGTFTSKIIFTFLDYKGSTIYTSKEGKSNRKDYKKSYTEAIRNVFKDEVILNHVYKPKLEKTTLAQYKTLVKSESNSDVKKEVFQLKFELRGKEYSFIPLSKLEYAIQQNTKVIGKAILQKNGVDYKIEAGTLTGKGSFDDFGNFTIIRVNPANKKELTDTMIRIK